jgi:hypothetical protein
MSTASQYIAGSVITIGGAAGGGASFWAEAGWFRPATASKPRANASKRFMDIPFRKKDGPGARVIRSRVPIRAKAGVFFPALPVG